MVGGCSRKNKYKNRRVGGKEEVSLSTCNRKIKGMTCLVQPKKVIFNSYSLYKKILDAFNLKRKEL